MIPFKEVEIIHAILIESFGGIPGIRDENLLLSALSRPFQTFDNSELYPTIIDKAAALIESLSIITLSLMEIKEPAMC